MSSETLPALTLPNSGSDIVPDWVHLCPSGTFTGGKGKRFSLSDPAGVIQRSLARGKIVLDENHSTDLAAPKGEPAPARGWITKMESRSDGLWGFVDWTPTGRRIQADRSYLGISPVIESAPGGGVLRILRASLTNTPDLTVVSLHSRPHQENTMEISHVRAALGLPDTATDEDVTRALVAARTSVTLHSQLASAVGGDPNAGTADLLAALRTRLAQEETSASRLAAMETQLAEQRAAASRSEIERLMADASRDGAVIDEKMRGNLVTLHSQNADMARDILSGMPRTNLNGGSITLHSQNAGAQPVDRTLGAIASGLGVTVEEIREHMGASHAHC